MECESFEFEAVSKPQSSNLPCKLKPPSTCCLDEKMSVRVLTWGEEEEFLLDKREERAKRRYKIYLDRKKEKERKDLSRNNKKPFGPKWYQELTVKQKLAADRLHQAIDDDLLDNRIDRCNDCVHGFGLNPFPIDRQLIFIRDTCHNNDFTFVWYLLQMFYVKGNITEKENFNINERILIMIICHLDMMTTLRALNQIFPPQVKIQRTRNPIPVKPLSYKKCKFESPYMEPQPRPRIQPKHIIGPPQLVSFNFRPYERYRDPEYFVENEPTRWWCSDNEEFDREAIFNEICQVMTDDQLIEELKTIAVCQCFDKMVDNDTFVHMVELNRGTEREFRSKLPTYRKQCLLKTIYDGLWLNFPQKTYRKLTVCADCDLCCDAGGIYRRLKNMKGNDNGSITELRVFETFSYDTPGSLCDMLEEKLDVPVTICLRNLWQMVMPIWFDPNQDRNGETIDPSLRVNPKSKSELNDLLVQAFTVLRIQYPKFVLVHIPDAHQLPIFTEWIRLRYGFRYTRAALTKQFERSRTLWSTFGGIRLKVAVPNVEDVGNTKIMTYDYRDRIQRRVDYLRRKYEDQVRRGIYDEVRKYWPTMGPFLCHGKSQPINEFYSYFPSNDHDIFLFRQ